MAVFPLRAVGTAAFSHRDSLFLSFPPEVEREHLFFGEQPRGKSYDVPELQETVDSNLFAPPFDLLKNGRLSYSKRRAKQRSM